MHDFITIKGAKEHNLKDIDLKIPKNKLVVITGLSGSGKSSLAFDTLFAEGQRRYVESLSSYARQFLEQLQKPNIEHIEGLSPAIAIEQRVRSSSPRSIVATQTEIYDYLRLLYARVGKPHCYKCSKPIQRQSCEEIIDQIFQLETNTKIYILSPIIRGKKGQYQTLFKKLIKEGFSRVRVDKKIHELETEIKLSKYNLHTIEIVIDRIKLSPQHKKRIVDSVETALKYSSGLLTLYCEDTDKELFFNTDQSCLDCQISIEDLEPRMFSFNSPYGACPACNGLGIKLEFDQDLIIPDRNKSINEGAIEIWRRGSKGYIMYYRALLRQCAVEVGFSLDTSFNKLKKSIQDLLIFGNKNVIVWDKPFEGIIAHLERIFRTTESDYMKQEISKYLAKLPCPECKGSRLRPESRSVYINGKSISEIIAMDIQSCYNFISQLEFNEHEIKITHQIIKEIKARLNFCQKVGLEYLSLDRLSSTLSGGEAQRIRLATQVGCALTGVLYILDEPTIGLHPRDDKKLIETLQNLRDLNNTVIVVEHDQQMINACDWIIDLGPGAGINGGKVIFSGELKTMLKESHTLTARYLRKELTINTTLARRDYQKKPFLLIKGAKEHNLKNIDVKIPLELFVCVTGVSGSGKSTLVEDILYRQLAKTIYQSKEKPGKHKKIEGIKHLDKIIIVDQSPIGRTPRSNPATYTQVFTPIRILFSQLPESKLRGYKASRFSFNVSGGRCESCHGDGTKKIEMHFLPDVYVPCQVCKGKKFNAQTLEVFYKGKNINDVLNLTVSQAMDIFENIPQIKSILKTLDDVGLGYITLGQSATTLSGGEAQRIKLAAQLRKKSTGKTLYLLDEPTTGLHFDDIKKLLSIIHRLVEKKNTVLVIEHNLDVMRSADYIIDLGPNGGADGGNIVCSGNPEEIAKHPSSHTGKFLRERENE